MSEEVHFVITLFGMVSIFVLIFSVASLALHFRILLLRGNADDSFAHAETLLRKHVDLFYDFGINHEDGRELCMMCEEADVSHAREAFVALPKIEKALGRLKVDNEKLAPLEGNKLELTDAAREYNNRIEKYNRFISKPPGSVMALVVGLKQEKMLRIQQS